MKPLTFLLVERLEELEAAITFQRARADEWRIKELLLRDALESIVARAEALTEYEYDGAMIDLARKALSAG